MSPSTAELVLYAAVWCADCARTRRFLKARGVAWREVDVDADPAAEARLLARQRGARLVPVLEYGRRRLTLAPFDREKLVNWLVEAGVASRRRLSDAAPSAPGR
ncbi:MAG TPA: glutaredoxin family protein [Candidatus Saccharimonadales bacterium]|nr:glutaredoxin family protein [Candidatus Saccharimonadales bacterium]